MGCDFHSLYSSSKVGVVDWWTMGNVWFSQDKETAAEEEMSIPGLDWGIEEILQKDQKKVPQKKVPYAKPIPAQFQQVT